MPQEAGWQGAEREQGVGDQDAAAGGGAPFLKVELEEVNVAHDDVGGAAGAVEEEESSAWERFRAAQGQAAAEDQAGTDIDPGAGFSADLLKELDADAAKESAGEIEMPPDPASPAAAAEAAHAYADAMQSLYTPHMLLWESAAKVEVDARAAALAAANDPNVSDEALADATKHMALTDALVDATREISRASGRVWTDAEDAAELADAARDAAAAEAIMEGLREGAGDVVEDLGGAFDDF